MPGGWASRPDRGPAAVLAVTAAGGNAQDRAGTAPGMPGASWLARHPAWPVTALLAGYPLWWALGVADYLPVVLAVPMAARMYAWRAHGHRRIRVPPGFT